MVVPADIVHSLEESIQAARTARVTISHSENKAKSLREKLLRLKAEQFTAIFHMARYGWFLGQGDVDRGEDAMQALRKGVLTVMLFTNVQSHLLQDLKKTEQKLVELHSAMVWAGATSKDIYYSFFSDVAGLSQTLL